MAVDITVNGTFRLNNTIKTPGFVYCYPMSSFYLGAVAITQSSPELGENPYKVAAVTGTPGAGGNVGTTVWTFSMIVPSTVDADVNPVGARWGFYVFSDDDVPRLIAEISDLKTFFLLATPTTVSLLDIRAQQGTSTPWPPSGGDQTVTGVLTVTGNLIVGGNVNGRDPDNFVDGTGTSLAYPIWTDANTLQNGYLKQETDIVSMTGTGGAPMFKLWTNGAIGDANYTRGALKADVNVVELTAERGGTFAAQVTAVRLKALGTGALVQIARDANVYWTFADEVLYPTTADFAYLGTQAAPILALILSNEALGGLRFAAASVDNGAIEWGGVAGRFRLTDGSTGAGSIKWTSTNVIDLTGSGSPEGVITADIGSIYRRTDGSTSTTLYVKTSGAGNTGWTAK